MEQEISEKTHTKCRVKIEQTLQDYYEFLVPNHLVNEEEMNVIDEKITDLIETRIERGSFGFSECNCCGELDDYSSLEVLDYELTGGYFDPDTDTKLPVYDTEVEWNDVV
jgi:hypothetical protein